MAQLSKKALEEGSREPWGRGLTAEKKTGNKKQGWEGAVEMEGSRGWLR